VLLASGGCRRHPRSPGQRHCKETLQINRASASERARSAAESSRTGSSRTGSRRLRCARHRSRRAAALGSDPPRRTGHPDTDPQIGWAHQQHSAHAQLCAVYLARSESGTRPLRSGLRRHRMQAACLPSTADAHQTDQRLEGEGRGEGDSKGTHPDADRITPSAAVKQRLTA
jgi:hypothetical protein